MPGVEAKHVQFDEIWILAHSKQNNVGTVEAAPEGAGHTCTAFDAASKIIISYLVGGRDAEYANVFMLDVAERLTGPVQPTTRAPRLP